MYIAYRFSILHLHASLDEGTLNPFRASRLIVLELKNIFLLYNERKVIIVKKRQKVGGEGSYFGFWERKAGCCISSKKIEPVLIAFAH